MTRRDVEAVGRYYDAYQAYLVRELPEDGRSHLRRHYIESALANPAVLEEIWGVLEKPSRVDAYSLARAAHYGQVDKAGRPYVEHVWAVAGLLEPYGEVAVMAGLLHDVVEDTEVTLGQLGELGYPQVVISAVASVTLRTGAGEHYFDMVQRAAQDPLGRLVKLADNRHNSDPARLAMLMPAVAHRLRLKYRAAREILLTTGPDLRTGGRGDE